MTRPLKSAVNALVRAYLRRSPVTEGKKQLLEWSRGFILPEESLVTFPTKHGFRLTGNLRNPEHQRMYFYGSHDERYEINNIVKLLQAGDACWDIGANIGFYTCLFAMLVKEQGRVVAFEPIAPTRAFLERNIRLNNGFQNITVKAVALGDVRGRREIFLDHPDLAEGTVSLKSQGGSQTEAVEIDTIDDLSGGLPVPDFIKIDVEGYQREVLKGGKVFFSRFSPMVMAELRDRDRAVMEQAEDFFRSHGYDVYEFHKFALQPCENVAESGKRNFLMVKKNSPYFGRLQGRISR